MAKTLRVHSLAKELGVTSKDIIAKCAAEGIELKNHMAAISVGLAESIREWFSAGDDVTSVEVAKPVDLTRVKKTPSRTRTAEADHGDEADEDVGVVQAVALEEPELETEALETRIAGEISEAESRQAESAIAEPAETATSAEEPAELAPTAAETAPEGEVVTRQPDSPEGPPEQTQTQLQPAAHEITAPGHVAMPEPPKPAKPVRPAGPQLVPKPAELKGPRVVRIEAPEPVRAPTPRRTRPSPAAFPGGGDFFAPAAGTEEARKARARGEPAESAERVRARSPRRRGSEKDVAGERMREWRDQDLIERRERLASATGFGLRERRAAEKRRTATTGGGGPAARKSEIEISEPIVLKDFCAAVGTPFTWVVRRLQEHLGNAPRNLNAAIDAETAELLALDLGITLKIAKAKTAMQRLQEEFNARERKNPKPRPPVVAMLGHVDHGKTSLLDRIRHANVAAGEAGGITQHVGAYRIQAGDWNVTFLDTPGHEAFTAMRARGANLTDVVVLVVAADDGVMPQTAEAINHAKAAGVQIVVALNKIDLPNVDLNRIYAQLAEHDLTPSEWGGQTDVIKTSATTGEGVEELITHLTTLSELLDLKADPAIPAQATVVEAQMREGQGAVAQVLVREGTLRRGQIVVCGPGCGRVRSLIDDQGRNISEAKPGTPVEVTGLDELPQAGDQLFVMTDLKRAKEIAGEVRTHRRQEALQTPQKAVSLADLLKAGDEAQVPELNLIVKADVQGSIDALRDKLLAFPSDKAKLNLLHAGVGAITEADVSLAQASSALVIGFHVVAEDRARQAAEQSGVEIRAYRIIYEVIDDVHKALEGLLAPEKKQETRGTAEVRQIFHVSRFGTVAGCFVTDGTIHRNNRVRLVRDGRIVVENAGIASLKRFKDDAREVRSGFECGIKIESYDDVKPGDRIEAFDVVEVLQKL